jgi:hypothetical protein
MSWKDASRCPKWEGCSIPVCPLSPDEGVRLLGEPECGERISRGDSKIVRLTGLSPDERWRLAEGLELPFHGLTQDEWEMVQMGEPLLVGTGEDAQGWLPERAREGKNTPNPAPGDDKLG